MREISLRINNQEVDQARLWHVLTFIGAHLDIKFILKDKDYDILYGIENKDENRYKFHIPFDEQLFRGDSPAKWRIADNILLLYSDVITGDDVVESHENIFKFKFDIFAAIFFLISRTEEYSCSVEDTHGRFPYSESILYKSNQLLDTPVDIYLNLIKSVFNKCGLEVNDKRQPTIILSHDIDQPLRSLKGSLKLIAVGERPFGSRIQGLIDSMVNPASIENNPFWNFNSYMDIENQYGYSSTWFFTNPFERTRYDPKYDIASQRFRNVINDLKANDNEIGLHSSYNSMSDEHKLGVEKSGAENKIRFKITGNRNHYLKLKIGNDLNKLVDAGFNYDSTMGYSSVLGYRCGTGLPFCLFDFENNRSLPLIEIPFAIMDSAIMAYNDKSVILSIVDQLLNNALEHKGTLGILWHLRTAYDVDYPGWLTIYEYILKKAHELGFTNMTSEKCFSRFQNINNELG
ncbi:MAG: hypothetical protein GY855_04280 [candidate division Zixibacteria bacterium]|nr:hypothetical protein [candidate division Zixibacteria bacterium]